MSNKILDNGTILTLGLVGAVAAIGAMKKRGSRSVATASVIDHVVGDRVFVIPACRHDDNSGSCWTGFVADKYADGDLSVQFDDGEEGVYKASELARATSAMKGSRSHGQHGRPPMLRMRSDMSLAAQLNDHGFAFEEVERGLLVDDAHDILIRIEGGMADIEKRKMDANGNLTGMKSLGEFPVHSVANMVAAMRGGSRATSASKAPSLGEYDDFVVATKSRGNKHAYYIEGHEGDLDDGWYYNGITWGVDLAGPYDNASEALRQGGVSGSRAKTAMQHPFGWAQVKGRQVVKLSNAQRKPTGTGWGAVNTSNTRIGSQAYLDGGTVYLR